MAAFILLNATTAAKSSALNGKPACLHTIVYKHKQISAVKEFLPMLRLEASFNLVCLVRRNCPMSRGLSSSKPLLKTSGLMVAPVTNSEILISRLAMTTEPALCSLVRRSEYLSMIASNEKILT